MSEESTSARLRRAQADLTEQLDGAEKQIAQLERDCDAALAARDDMTSRALTLQAELTSARAELDQQRRYVATLERALSGADDAAERLRGELAAVERERDGVRDELARQADECEDLRVTLGARAGALRRADDLVDAISEIARRVARAAGVTSLRLADVRRGVDGLLAELEQRRATQPNPTTHSVVENAIQEPLMSEIVCTVTPTIQDGTVVRWYRSETAAETRRVMVSASRNGVQVGEHLTNGEVPAAVMALAAQAWAILRTDNDADLSGWATHRRERVFGGTLVRIEREATDA